MWDPPRPGLEPVSPALAGVFSTTVPPGKPQPIRLLMTMLAVMIMNNQVFSQITLDRFTKEYFKNFKIFLNLGTWFHTTYWIIQTVLRPLRADRIPVLRKQYDTVLQHAGSRARPLQSRFFLWILASCGNLGKLVSQLYLCTQIIFF